MTETTVLDFKVSNTFDEYRAHMNAPEQQAMFAEMGVKTFFIGVCKDDPKRATVIFQGPEDISTSSRTQRPSRLLKHLVMSMKELSSLVGLTEIF